MGKGAKAEQVVRNIHRQTRRRLLGRVAMPSVSASARPAAMRPRAI